MGGSRGVIFIDKYWLNQDKLLQRGIYFGRWFDTLLTLESNGYQLYMLKFVSNVVQKLSGMTLFKADRQVIFYHPCHSKNLKRFSTNCMSVI